MSPLKVLHDLGTGFTVRDGDVELFQYTYRPDSSQLESPKPFIHPLRTRSGRLVSLFRPHDHVWHKGIAWSLPHIGDENFWGGPTYIHGRFYVQLDNNGAQVHNRVLGVSVTDDEIGFAHSLTWVAQDGRTIMTEVRRLGATLLADDAWALRFDTEMTNVTDTEIVFASPTTRGRENAGYGGLFWRGPRSFTGGTLVTEGASGGDELRGTHEEWMAFAGRHDDDDATSLVLMLDHELNPHHPPQWFARSEDFACLNPAPFFTEELVLQPGATVRFRYGVGVATGGVDDAPGLASSVRAMLATPGLNAERTE